ncbi:apoptotic protease-activating factor 1 isoform X2 [Latimeria chalumnae]|uniref:apoptotic protease-activating factor 1 isoform X2 n=1 Tax=Latimeria chalumnae TaxID=7897 RepID=UPI0003C17736|nr:PREDICTED: apoptotic protease-activating factor 1 isoform X2 [Latimeria chalumnae]|eukprot:XP_005991379.1 PREDICTED: apoptotic protease-activating factor 1 isoform X2 [Latimeria chalumnae]
MDEKARSCLLRHRAALERDIKTSYIIDHMISDEVLTLEEEQNVKTLSTQRDRGVRLINIILRKDNYTYISFYNALLHEGYKDLAALLQDCIPIISPLMSNSKDDNTPYVQARLCEGGVPQRPVVFVTRMKLIQAIRKEVYKLQDDPGWVTVYGMAGCGKSVLAAEALRDHKFLNTCFPGGVHWISIGKQDRAGLLVKLQNLCVRLDQDSQASQRPPLNIEEAKDRLRLLMFRKFPRSLLILDDVWDSWVLKAFDIQCRVLITTRDIGVTDTVTGKKYTVHVNSGLEHEKALEVLALFVNMKVSELPTEAHIIVNECKGSPLVVSLIGALLKEFPKRWQYYLKQLQNKQFKRIRKSSSYDYEALDEAMSISIEVLSEDRKGYYKDLSVLEKDVKVPTKVLCVLWDMETEDVEDILQVFVNKSLLFCDRNGNSFLYYLHDLQLDFLTEQNRDHLPQLHAKMVNQYQKSYKKCPPAPIEDDCMYWYNFLAYHMVKANMHKELYSLMFSLDWIKAKTELMGPAHLISEFVQYRHILDEENSTVRDNFQEFLSLNGHLLVQKPLPDIVQLGLCQPSTSEVYRQARLKAEQKREKRTFYLDWVNKGALVSLTRLVVRPHTDTVYHACFSSDGQKIASCGADRTLQILKSETGERLLEINDHDDEVLCCAFSPDNKLVATCTTDKKVKVWNSETGNLIKTYEEHAEQVNHCEFNNTSEKILLATCSDDTYLKLWDINEKHCRNTLFGHEGYVNHCLFSPDDHYLASCSNDGTLKLWDVESANEWKSIDVKELFLESEDNQNDAEVLVKCCSWSSDSARVMAAAKNIIFVFDVETSTLLTEIKMNPHSTIYYFDFCPRSQMAAVAVSPYSVELWNIESNKRVADLRGHLSWVRSVRFSPDGSTLLSSSDDQTVRLWETNKVHKSSVVSLKRVLDVLFHGDDVTILAPDNRKQLQLITAGFDTCQSEAQDSRVCCCCLSKNRQSAALGHDDGIVKILTLPDFKTIRATEGHKKSVQKCQFTPDGQTLITSSDDATILLWNWQTEDFKVLQGHSEQVKNFKLLDNKRLLSWSFDGTVKVWDITSGEVMQDFACHDGAVLCCDVSPNGTMFSSTSADKTAKVWSFSNPVPLYVLEGHKDCVRSCRFSWNSKFLATGDDDGEIRIWKVSNGKLLNICPKDAGNSTESKHGGWVTDLHFSPDSKILVSTGGYIKWWCVNTGEPLQTFYTNGTNLKSIHVSPDFKTYVTIDNIGIPYILKMVE